MRWAVQRQLGRDELIAFLDDINMKISLDRVVPVNALQQQELWRHARIRVHRGKHRCGTAQVCSQQDVTCWIKILGTPLGHEEFVRTHWQRTIEEHTVLLERIPGWKTELGSQTKMSRYTVPGGEEGSGLDPLTSPLPAQTL